MSPAEKLDFATKIVALIGASWASVKFGLKVHRRMALSIGNDVEERVSNKLDEKLEPIINELRPNGGSSLADKVSAVLTKLEHHSGRVRAFNRDTSQGIFEADPDGSFKWTNRTFLHTIERTEEEMLGFNWINCIRESDRAKVMDHWMECIEQGRECLGILCYVTPTGEEILVNVRAAPIKSESTGKVLGFMGFVRPIADCDMPAENCPLRRSTDRSSNADH